MIDQARFDQAISKIDAANAQDPNTMQIAGQMIPVAVVHAKRRTAWVQQLMGDAASEALLLATRAQHLRRWVIPRDTYPRDRIGYLTWRRELKQFHAEETAQILREVGYDETLIKRVQTLILKRDLKRDPEVQVLEDALCLVFLETQFTDFAKKEADKIINIIRRTWVKMSPQGQQLALQLPLTAGDRAVIEAALADG